MNITELKKHIVPKGFLVSGISAGLKKSGRKDLGLIVSEVPALCAGVFTRNAMRAAPVVLNQQRIGKGPVRALVINSGNANCATGASGLKDARTVTMRLARALRIPEQSVLMGSTGKIGVRLPVSTITAALGTLIEGLSREELYACADAILTTDTVRKVVTLRCTIDGAVYTITAFAKGAGMIQPDMATMLCFILTDAPLARRDAQKLLKEVVETSFNRITIDGQMSTNDMVLLLANGKAARNSEMLKGSQLGPVREALGYLTRKMAALIVEDGEGASRFIEVTVTGAGTTGQADKTARELANSPLIKTACGAGNPNWGRIAQAIGAINRTVDPRCVSIGFYTPASVSLRTQQPRPVPLIVFDKGRPGWISGEKLERIMKGYRIGIMADLGKGRYTRTIWTCDLSEGYIAINKKY
ncbi:MAG: bifunctional glutamate N-acetyltransferase/amino-acid acetyltransferase ArgJ [Candidatus Omnitrophica bacterium]|nr:bifunctional glutamate N-acetyltransferase/amino-acid acetyltransferase ArgJ [Candidatus Omnitrophota bacterium]